MSPAADDPADDPAVDQLLARSHRLGADPRNTNYAGGNTSAKGRAIDPITGDPVAEASSREFLAVRGRREGDP